MFYENLKRYFHIKNDFLMKTVLYTVVLIITYMVFTALKPLYGVIKNGAIAQAFLGIILFCCFLYVAICAYLKSLSAQKIIALIFFVGFILRLYYMLITPASVRQYDTFVSYNSGHEAYAWTLFSQKKLPSTNEYQFYHPPLNALIQSLFMHITHALSFVYIKIFGIGDAFYLKFSDAGLPSFMAGESKRYYLFSTCQILSIFYSVLTMVVGYKILKAFNISGKSLVISFAFFAFFPRHIVFSATLNNDPLSYLFSLLAIYYTIVWWNDKKFKNIMLIALFVGLGMMTKLSSATICLPIAVVFLIEFIKTIRKKSSALSMKDMVVQYSCFLLLSVPLGLWFQVYAKIRFDQPFGYVFPYLNGALSTSSVSLFSRFFITFDFNEYFRSIYIRCFYNAQNGLMNNYNVWNVLIRSAIFGEFGYWQAEGYAICSILIELMFLYFFAISFALALIYFIKSRKDKVTIVTGDDKTSKAFIILFFLAISQIVPYLLFYYKMPYTCTLDFRYIMPIILCFSATIHFVYKKMESLGKWTKLLGVFTQTLSMAFICFTTLFYMNCI